MQGRAAADVAVVPHVLLERQRDQHVFHLAAHEAADEAVLGHVEEAEVVGDRFAARGVVDHDGVVAEAFPEDLARAHRDHADPDLRRRGLRMRETRGER